MKYIIVALFLITLVNASIIKITSEDQFTNILNKRKVVFAEFITPFCPKCDETTKKYSEAYARFESSGDTRKFISIDCSTFGVICNRFNISSYPSYAYIFANSTKIEYPLESEANNDMYTFISSIPANITMVSPIFSTSGGFQFRINPVHLVAGIIVLATLIVYLVSSFKSPRYEPVAVQYEEKYIDDGKPLLSSRRSVKELQRI